MPTGCLELGKPSGEAQGQPQGYGSESSSCWKLKCKISEGLWGRQSGIHLANRLVSFPQNVKPSCQGNARACADAGSGAESRCSCFARKLIEVSGEHFMSCGSNTLQIRSRSGSQAATDPSFPSHDRFWKRPLRKRPSQSPSTLPGPESRAGEGGGPGKG